jgi:hypothetical protein
MIRSGVIISSSNARMCSDVIPSAPGELLFFREKEKMQIFSSESSKGGYSEEFCAF